MSERTPQDRVEQAAIEVAETYAGANGYTERSARGLVLAGMAIASLAGAETQAAFLSGYLGSFPDAGDVLKRWAARLDDATVQ